MPDDNRIVTRRGVSIAPGELDFSAVRARGPGGQNVNKSATAVQLRFDIRRSRALDDDQRRRLLESADTRLSSDGVLVIKAQETRSQERNRDEAIRRLVDFIDAGLAPVRERKPTRPGKAADKRRLEEKARRGRLKALRGKVDD